MRVSVQKLPREIGDEYSDAAVVVDVLRATSVIATALQCGASEVVTCAEIEAARQMAAQLTPRPLLCGERHCQPIPGFDVGNSPSEYTTPIVAGRTLVMTTTNGTRALEAARSARSIYTAAFVNLSAVTARLAGHDNLTVVCAGTDGAETEEDLLFAGALIARLSEWGQAVSLDSAAQEVAETWTRFARDDGDLTRRLSQSQGGKNLVAAGYLADIGFCAAVDSMPCVPQVRARDPITLIRSPR